MADGFRCCRLTGAVLLLSCLINEIGSSLLSMSADNAHSTILDLPAFPAGPEEMSTGEEIERTNHDKVAWESWIVKNFACCIIWWDFWMFCTTNSRTPTPIIFSRHFFQFILQYSYLSIYNVNVFCSKWSEAFDTIFSGWQCWRRVERKIGKTGSIRNRKLYRKWCL